MDKNLYCIIDEHWSEHHEKKLFCSEKKVTKEEFREIVKRCYAKVRNLPRMHYYAFMSELESEGFYEIDVSELVPTIEIDFHGKVD